MEYDELDSLWSIIDNAPDNPVALSEDVSLAFFQGDYPFIYRMKIIIGDKTYISLCRTAREEYGRVVEWAFSWDGDEPGPVQLTKLRLVL